jgi:uncharacterized protein YacL
MILRRIDPLSAAKVLGVLYAALGLLIGLVVSCLSALGFLAALASRDHKGLPVVIGVLAIVVAPVFYGALGFVSGLVTAGLYNLAARAVGGIRIEVEAPAA